MPMFMRPQCIAGSACVLIGWRMDFRPVPWDEPLNPASTIARVPANATMAGLFIIPLARIAESQRLNMARPASAYKSDTRYPLVEHVRLLAEVAAAQFPDRTLRRGLYALGRGAVDAYMKSMVGRVTIGATEDPELILRAAGRGYELNLSNAEVDIDFKPGLARVTLRNVPYFLDCHHVGLLEGMLRRSGIKPSTEVALLGRDSAVFRMTW